MVLLDTEAIIMNWPEHVKIQKEQKYEKKIMTNQATVAYF